VTITVAPPNYAIDNDDPQFDLFATLISQYGNSPIIKGLIDLYAQWLNPNALFNSFFDKIWNVYTALGYGLDVWGRIVVIDRNVSIVTPQPYFGFDEATDAEPFNQGIFFNGGAGSTTNFRLTDEAFLQLILAKALTNIWDGSMPSLNKILLTLFPGRGDCYVTNGLNMTMTYTFTFALTPVETAIVNTGNALPAPTGVGVSIVTP